jgi:hypothetical protein
MLIAAKDLERPWNPGGFLDLLYGGNSGQHEEWIWTADLLVQC